jgi:hypothetical protein
MAIHAYTMIVNRQAIAARVSSLHYRLKFSRASPKLFAALRQPAIFLC